MFTEARKIQLIEEVMKTTNESTLAMLETVLKKSSKLSKSKSKSAYDFSGIWTKKDARLIEKAIEEGCGQKSITQTVIVTKSKTPAAATNFPKKLAKVNGMLEKAKCLDS